jgi:hypothetical protein
MMAGSRKMKRTLGQKWLSSSATRPFIVTRSLSSSRIPAAYGQRDYVAGQGVLTD